jgi:hypothetical protein
VLAIVGVCIVALIAMLAGWQVLSPRSNATTAADASVSGCLSSTGSADHGTPVGLASAGKAHVVITPAQAAEVLNAFWPTHERAVVARDIAGLCRLETGAAAVYEPGAVACGCLTLASPRALAQTSFFVPRQTTYPAHFLVEALHYVNAAPWTDILVFTKAGPTAAWLVAEDSGFAPLSGPARLGTAVTDADGYVLPPSAQQRERARNVAHQLASLWQEAKDSGRVPTQTVFETRGQTGIRLARIAAFPQDERQSNGIPGHARFYVDTADPLVEYNDAGFDLACQPIRETMAYHAGFGRTISQDDAQQNWGTMLAPGRYKSLTNHGAWQTCFLISPDPAVPVTILNQDIDGGVPIAK